MSFGNKLKILRVSNKLDQETISRRLNISQPVYSRYENDEKEVKHGNALLQRVAAEFDVTEQWLLADETLNLVSDAEPPNHGMEKNYYSVPKDFLEAFLKQQEMTEKILGLLTAHKSSTDRKG